MAFAATSLFYNLPQNISKRKYWIGLVARDSTTICFFVQLFNRCYYLIINITIQYSIIQLFYLQRIIVRSFSLNAESQRKGLQYL